MLKKILSILCILALVFSLSIPAFAVESATVLYVVEQETQASVNGLVVGETYHPDRMPNTVPDGKYFAGWQDANGNFVLKDGITLASGENKLIACFKEYPQKASVSLPCIGQSAMPSFDENGENYLNYMNVSNGYLHKESVTDGNETYTRFYNRSATSAREIFTFVDSDGAAYQLKPATKYHVSVTYKKPDYQDKPVTMEVVAGLLPEKRLSTGDIGRYVQSVSSVSQNTDTSLKREWQYNWNKGGHGVWSINAASENWQTTVYTFTTGDFNGYLPVAMMGLRLGAYKDDVIEEIYIKNITITVDGYVAPPGQAKVNYFVNDELVKVKEDVTEGDLFTVDYMPQNIPEGKYFAGWQDANGNFVESITLEQENNFYACLKDYPGLVYPSLDLSKLVSGSKVFLPTLDENGENYSAVSNFASGYATVKQVQEDTNKYISISPSTQWAQSNAIILPDSFGAAYQVKPSTEYTVKVTYKMPVYVSSMAMTVVAGISANQRISMSEPMNRYAQAMGSVTSFTDKSITAEYVYNSFINGAYYRHNINAASSEWQTIVYNLKTGDLNGFVPAIALAINLRGSVNGEASELVIKEVEIYEKGYSAPATVNYYYGDELLLSDTDAVVGGKIRTDIVPNGFVLVGWYEDIALSNQARDYVNKEELNLYGKFIPEDTKINVTYKNGEETLRTTNIKVFSKLWNGKNGVFGKAFFGWFTDKELTVPYTSLYAGVEDITLYGKFVDYVTEKQYSSWPTRFGEINTYIEYEDNPITKFTAGGYSYKDGAIKNIANPNNEIILANSNKWTQGGSVIIYDPETGDMVIPKPSSTYEISVTFTVPQLDANAGSLGVGFGMEKQYYSTLTNTYTNQYETLYSFTEAFTEPVTVTYKVYVPENPGNSIVPCFCIGGSFGGPSDSTKQTVLSYISISNISIKEVSTNVDFTYGGASILTKDVEEQLNKQAIRVYYNYTLDSDGKITDTKGNKYTVKERGVIFKADSVSDASLSLDNIGKYGVYGIHNYKNLEKCWSYDQETGVVTFSARVNDLLINDARKIQFRGYIVLDDNTVCYSDTITVSVAEINEATDTDEPQRAEKEKIAIMLVIGQSNAHNSGFGEEKTLSEGTNGLWQISAMPTTTDYGAVYMSDKGAVTSLSPTFEYSSNFADEIGGFAPAYAARWYELTGQRVVVLRLSKGATALAEWQKDANTNMSHYKELSGDSSDMGYDNGYYLYARAVNAFNETYEALKENYDIATTFYAWNQGESEEKFTSETATIYTDALYDEYFTKLHNDLLNDCPGLDYGTIIAVRSCTNNTHSSGKWWQSGNSTNAKRAQYRVASRRDDIFMVSWYTENCNRVVNDFAQNGLTESVWGGNWDIVPSIKNVYSSGNMHYTQLNCNIFGKEAAENFYASIYGNINFTGVNVRDNDNNQIVFFTPDGKGSGSITYDGTKKYQYLQIRPEDPSCTYDFSLSIDKESKQLIIDLYTDGSHHASGNEYVSEYGEVYWDKLTAEGINTLEIVCNIH